MFKLHMKDPGSAITHFIAMILSILAATPLLLKSYRDTGHFTINSLSLAIFIVSMILLYAASTTYHTLDISPKVNRILRKIDHMMIFVLIAGTYTPVCMVVLGDLAKRSPAIKSFSTGPSARLPFTAGPPWAGRSVT